MSKGEMSYIFSENITGSINVYIDFYYKWYNNENQ